MGSRLPDAFDTGCDVKCLPLPSLILIGDLCFELCSISVHSILCEWILFYSSFKTTLLWFSKAFFPLQVNKIWGAKHQQKMSWTRKQKVGWFSFPEENFSNWSMYFSSSPECKANFQVCRLIILIFHHRLYILILKLTQNSVFTLISGLNFRTWTISH